MIKPKLKDLTKVLGEAKTLNAEALKQLADEFGKGRVYIPLKTTKGVKNKPDFVEEKGPKVPAHLLPYADGTKAAVWFSNSKNLLTANNKLKWKTDRKRLKCLMVPGNVALQYGLELLCKNYADNLIFNLFGEGELFLTENDLLGIRYQNLKELEKYAPNIPMNNNLGTTFKTVQTFDSLGDLEQNFSNTMSGEFMDNFSFDSIQNILNLVNEKVFAEGYLEKKPGLTISVSGTGGKHNVKSNLTGSHKKKLEFEVKEILKENTKPNEFVNFTLDFSETFKDLDTNTKFTFQKPAPKWSPPIADSKTTKPNSKPKKKSKPAKKSKTKKFDFIPLEPEED